MDALVTATTETAIERAQTSASSCVRIKIGAHLDDTADSSGFLREEEGGTKGIPCRTIDAVEFSQTTLVDWRQKRDAMIRIRDIEIDTCHMSEIAAFLMSLKQEMPAIIIVRRGATRIMIK